MEELKKEISKAVVGYEEVVELLAVALLSRGHVIIEGVPGIAKTTIAKAFAKSLGLQFSRIQLTPDLMPADITGSFYFDLKTSEFKFRKGPIFANIVLADEINRAMPKTQSAMLEAMQERQVTVEGMSYKLPEPFMVIATMNPVESESVYKLPEAQLDRFMMKIRLEYLGKEKELEFLRRKASEDFEEVATVNMNLRFDTSSIRVSEKLVEYVYRICSQTRFDNRVLLGASPRAMEHLLKASQSLAFLRGRDYVLPDDVKYLAKSILPHRIILKAEYEIDGLKAENVVLEIIEKLEVPK
ncbi:MAG: MoxR family ATPase [Archaeoglobaceae archaeon]|nr:MoxR family ATPase [Archaeoglobaceae archaeon]MDW8117373.1 MoxR family ATPase [Archaeoglobaceae archaeon]